MPGEVTHPPTLIVRRVAPLDLVRIAQPCMPCACICIKSLCDATLDDAWLISLPCQGRRLSRLVQTVFVLFDLASNRNACQKPWRAFVVRWRLGFP